MANVLVLIKGIDQVTPVLAGIQAKSAGLGGAMGSALRKGSLVGAAAVVGLGVVAIKSFADFDAAMTQSLAIMGDVSSEQRGEMADAARKMARETTFSAKQAADSYFFLASAGLDAKASVKALPVVAKFAQAGMFDMASATSLLADAQSALGLTIRDDAVANMKNMIRVSDVLVKANNLANANVEQFSTALTTEAGAALKSFKIDVEEGVAVLAAFADQGIKGEVAGSGLSRVLRLMTAGAVKNADAYKTLGVRVFDSSGNINNLADIVGDLEGALGGMSDAERVAALQSLGFQARVQGIILPLLGTSTHIREYEQQLRNAGGTTEDVAHKQLQTFSKQMTLMKHRIQDVFIVVGGALVPGLTKFLRLMMEKLIPAVSKFIKLNLKEVLVGLGVAGAIAGYAIAVAWAPAVAGFIAAAAPFVAVAAAAALVGAAVALLEKKTGFFSKKLLPTLKKLGREALPELEDFGRTALKMAKDIAKFLAPSLDTLADLWSNVLGPALKEVVKLLKVTVLPVLKAVGKFLLDHKPLLIAAAAAILLLVAPWLAVVAAIAVVLAKWDEISAFFIGIKNTVVNTFNSLPNLLLGVFKDAWDSVLQVFAEVLDTLRDFADRWKKILVPIAGIITGLLLPRMALLATKSAIAAGKVIAQWVAMAAKAVASAAVLVAQIALMIAKWVLLGAQSLIQAAKVAAAWIIALGPIAWATAAIIAIAALIIMNWDTIMKWTGKLRDFFVNTFNSLPGPIKAVMEFIFNNVKAKIDGVIQVFRSMYTIINNIVQLVDNLVHGRWGAAWANLKAIAVGALNLLLGNIKVLLGNIPAVIIGLIAQVATAAGKLGAALGTGIAHAVKGGINSLITFFERGLNIIIRKWNSLEFKVPSVNLGPLGKIGGGTVGVPDIPLASLPRLKQGAFEILNNTLAQLHKGEMVVPQPFAKGLRAQMRQPVAAMAGARGGDFNFYGNITLSGKATREDATALLDMIEAEWKARRRRGM